MRLSLIVLSFIALTACSHQAEKVSSETTTVMPATYAMSVPAAKPNPCAENFNGIVDNLEGLMAADTQKAH